MPAEAPVASAPGLGLAMLLALLAGVAALSGFAALLANPTPGAVAATLVLAACGLLATAACAVSLRQAYVVRRHAEARLRELDQKARADVSDRKRAEERFALAARATKDVVYDYDVATRRLLWGAAMQEVFGHDAQALEPDETAWTNRIHPDDLPRVAALFHRTMEGTGNEFRSEYRFLHADGRWLHVFDRFFIVRDAEGKAVRAVGAMTDISQLTKAEADLRASEARWRSLAENVPADIVTVDAKGRIRSTNRPVPPFGHLPGGGIGHHAWEATSPPRQEALRDAILAAVAGRAQAIETDGPGPDGTRREYQMTWTPLAGSDGAAAIGIALDVTEQRRAERERDAARREAERTEAEAARMKDAAAFKTQFLNAAAHELATPLTPLKLQLATLRARADRMTAEDAAALDLLGRNVDRLGILVNDLLDAARLQSGRLRLIPRPVSLAGLVSLVASTFAEQAAQARVSLGVHGKDRAPTVVCDEARVTQVLFNLVHNAIKFTPAGGHVAIEAGQEDGKAVLRVRDDGAGMDADQLSRLFEPFVQVHEPAQGRPGGTGLGLYIARGIVEQHGGRLEAASAGPGGGSTFTVVLPLGVPPTLKVPPRARAA